MSSLVSTRIGGHWILPTLGIDAGKLWVCLAIAKQDAEDIRSADVAVDISTGATQLQLTQRTDIDATLPSISVGGNAYAEFVFDNTSSLLPTTLDRVMNFM